MENIVSGDIVVSTFQGEKGAVICVYGNPEGLRYLASQLEQLANLDQESLSQRELPFGEGMHISFTQEQGLNKNSNGLNIGRLDARGSRDYSWYLSQFE